MLNLNSKLTDTIAQAEKNKRRPMEPEKMEAFFFAAEIAMKAVIQAGADGNVRCKEAVKEMAPHLAKMKRNESV